MNGNAVLSAVAFNDAADVRKVRIPESAVETPSVIDQNNVALDAVLQDRSQFCDNRRFSQPLCGSGARVVPVEPKYTRFLDGRE